MKAIMFPGQGSQYKGMGKELFKAYPNETSIASNILGFDLEDLCVNDFDKKLSLTQYTQPALFVVNALAYYQYKGTKPDFLIGHSLGEYNALHAAGVFDFETGVKLVKKRGELMASASGGAMTAIIGITSEELKGELEKGNHDKVEVANFNSPSQTVVAGTKEAIDRLNDDFQAKGIRIVPLMVSAPFHSSLMKPAAEEFTIFMNQFVFNNMEIPVISNYTAGLYEFEKIPSLLSNQIANSVQWTDSIRLLSGYGVTDFEEIGGIILTKMCDDIQKKCTPIQPQKNTESNIHSLNSNTKENKIDNCSQNRLNGTVLGSPEFKKDFNIDYAYYSGAMYRGIASADLVIQMGKAKLLGFLGTGGMSLNEIESNIQRIQKELHGEGEYGLNLLHNLIDPEMEMKTVDLYLKYGIKNIEAAAYMQITDAIVYFRLKGLKNDNGKVICDNKIIAKVSRPEVAELFMKPAPEKIVRKLLDKGLITSEQVDLSRKVPLSYDICVEADSGGHTDAGVALVLLPSIQQLRSSIEQEFIYDKKIRIGLAGGIGTPQAVACAFIMKADFVVTGSINQCTVEAGTSDIVKDLLQEINVQDTDYAPAGDMFELGAKVQVLKKSVLFSTRANKLYNLYQQYDSIDAIPEKNKLQLEKNYFKKELSKVWEETKVYLREKNEEELIKKAEQNPKEKMALVFRWYFGFSNRMAVEGIESEKVNFQIHTGPALGAFNQWVKGTSLESWRNRHVDQIGIKIMNEAAIMLQEQLKSILN